MAGVAGADWAAVGDKIAKGLAAISKAVARIRMDMKRLSVVRPGIASNRIQSARQGKPPEAALDHRPVAKP
ncbi:hypothetical protein GCM10010833_26900 [Blastomonas aquatica]|uniref:Uncharacterized protein n=1 Tax=Blastomonas aquatica TaxID=1510276 RepID=A0ABQ1JMM8_9SPHN|nr:hypothetical protein GCM10010833_26900 [Blastomonas aquatica]